jgi:TonB-dependent SusC/RagA subfamily outer membrane receptor
MLFLFFGKTNAAKAQIGKIAVNSCRVDSVKKVNSNTILNGRLVGMTTKHDTTAIKRDVIARKELPGEVVLNKLEIEKNVKSYSSDRIVLGRVSYVSNKDNSPLYIIDGVPFLKGLPAEFKPDDIENISILKAKEAAAIFGPEAAAGAIVITTKIKNAPPVYKSMDSVFITSGTVCKKGYVVMGGMTAGVKVKRTLADTVKMVTTKITGALKIYPNPVKKGNPLTIDLKLANAGSFNVQVIDAGGKVVLQQQVVAGSKNYTGQLQTSSNWSSGVYYIRVFDSNNKMMSTNSVLVQ